MLDAPQGDEAISQGLDPRRGSADHDDLQAVIVVQVDMACAENQVVVFMLHDRSNDPAIYVVDVHKPMKSRRPHCLARYAIVRPPFLCGSGRARLLSGSGSHAGREKSRRRPAGPAPKRWKNGRSS